MYSKYYISDLVVIMWFKSKGCMAENILGIHYSLRYPINIRPNFHTLNIQYVFNTLTLIRIILEWKKINHENLKKSVIILKDINKCSSGKMFLIIRNRKNYYFLILNHANDMLWLLSHSYQDFLNHVLLRIENLKKYMLAF